MKTRFTGLLSKINFKSAGIALLLLASAGFTQNAFAQAPANDNCAGAIAFPTIPTDQSCASVIANTEGATESIVGCTGTADDDVWYSFVCPAGYTSLRYSNTDISGSGDRVIEFFSGACGTLLSIGCNDDENGTVTGLTPGATYYLRVYTYFNEDTTQVSVCLRVPPPPPANDECAGAIAFPTIPTNQTCVSVTANTNGATQSLADCDGTADDDVWYSFVCPTGFTSLRYANTDVSGSSDRVIEFYSGACGNLVSLGCHDNESGTVSGLTAGFTYYFRIYTYDGGSDSTQVSVCLETPPPPPANDECAGAIAFPTIPTDQTCVSVNANTNGATRSLPDCNGTADDDVWYSFVCPVGYNGVLYENTDIDGSSDRVIEFYSGACGNLVSLGCNGDSQGAVTGLTGGNTYYFRIYSYNEDDSTEVSVCLKTPPPPPANDEASGAIELTLGSGCTGAPYTNVGGSQSAGEPFPNVRGTSGSGTTWFKFVAPASGMVKITNDYAVGTADDDTKLGLFSATDSLDYSTFVTVAGDDDNGVTVNTRSTIFAAGLTSGTTYYIAYDGFDASVAQGTFCITVDEMNSTMLATTGSCDAGSGAYANNSFGGWRSLLTSTGLLIANVKQNPGVGGSASSAAITVNTTGVRTNTTGIPYLDRNYSFTSDVDTPADVQLFFSAADFAALNGTIVGGGGSPVTLADLNVTHQLGTCQANFDQTNGVNSLLTQTANGTTNGVDFIQVSTPGFSNFYIMAGTVPLPLKLISFTGQNNGAVNALAWQTVEEKNFSHFELQRSSNGSDYTKLAIVEGKNVVTGSKYQYNDMSPLEGRNFYRLLMVDMNGKTNLSNVVELTSKTGSGLAVVVHPNPIKAVMQINIAGRLDGNANILIMDIMGKVLQTIYPTSNNVSVDMNAMPAGTYIVKYIDNSHSIITKVIKD